jgi:beta-glucanase (GH16 family)
LQLNAQITLIDKNWTLNKSLSDEFNTYNGTFPTQDKYFVFYQPNDNPLIQNTNRPVNLYIENNDVVAINVLKDNYKNGSFIARPFSTADFQTNSTPYLYGYFEAMIKLPKGDGYHPAFWL